MPGSNAYAITLMYLLYSDIHQQSQRGAFKTHRLLNKQQKKLRKNFKCNNSYPVE